MTSEFKFQNIRGILTILADEPNWPNSANIYVIPDENGFSLIDVGCGGISSSERLREGLRHWQLKIGQLHTVVLSHAHPDHMGAIGWILEEANPMVYVHHLDMGPALDPRQLDVTFDIPLAKDCWAAFNRGNELKDFSILNYLDSSGCLMSAAASVETMPTEDILHLSDFEFHVMHTPGHSPGHVSFFEKNRRILLAGDLVGKAPAWYVPAAGGVIGYLDSLAKLEGLDAAILLPAHGPIIEEARQAIRKIQKKLLQRESILIQALQDGAKNFMELNKALLGDSHLNFFPGCGIIESHLVKMEREGVINREGQRIISIK
jgi:glyoxylase-like metal-dependent hydrolase (beta-lactamase superfamily II)